MSPTTESGLVAVGPGRADGAVADPAMGGLAEPLAGALAEPVIRLARDGKPETSTLVRVGTFEGPLALLLSLIEQRELDIRSVALGELAGAYLEALAAIPGDRMPHISSFLAVASQLILIKSRAILPEPPELEVASDVEILDPAEELRQRLIAYRAYRDASRLLAARLEAGEGLFHREASAAGAAARAGARAPDQEPLDPLSLPAALAALIRLTPPPPPPPETMGRSVTLAERAAVLRAALARAPVIVLQELLREVTDRVVIAVTFLAMLELSKRRELLVEQEVPWGPIVCRRPAQGTP